MRYERFEDLPVWQAAVSLAASIFRWTSHPWFRAKGDLANQLQRATLSISNNIAEGFERGSTQELLQFLYISRGSAGEVRSMLCVIEQMEPPADEFVSQIAAHKSQCEQISRQLHGWVNSLKNSEIQGQRHQTAQTQQAYEQRQRRNAFQQKLDAANADAHRQREEERLRKLRDENPNSES